MALTTEWLTVASTRLQHGSGDITFYVGARLVQQDVTNNRSQIERAWWYTVNGGGYMRSYDTQHYLTGNGWTEKAYWDSGTSGGTILQQKAWIAHNDDGTGTYSCWGATYLGGLGTETGWVGADNLELPTIPRASVPSVTPNPITLSNTTNTITVNTNRKASSFTHNVTCTIGSFTQTKTGVTTSTTFDIPKTVLASFATNSKTLNGTITCITKNGSTTIGTKSTTFTAQIDTSQEYPKINSVVIEDTNSRTSAVTQDDSIYIANISTLKATITFSAVGSYTNLKSYTVLCGNDTRTGNFPSGAQNAQIELTFDRINVSSFDVIVVDDRGVSRGTKKTWTLIAYQPVTATATVARTTATGSVATGQLTGMAYGGSFGATQNSLTITVDFKKHSDSAYTGTETYTLALSQSGYNSWSDALTFQYALDYQYQYDIRFTVSDLFSTATYVAQLMQGLPILSWDETEVDVWGKLHIHDREKPTQYWDFDDTMDAIFQYHANKNLLTITATTTTVNGITFTVNDDGTITANGTASDIAVLLVGQAKGLDKTKYEYWFTGCPENGSATTYYTGFETMSAGGSTIVFVADTGDGHYLDQYENFGATLKYYICIMSGQTVSNLVFKPMVRDARIASDDYVHNAPSTTELASNISTLSTALNNIAKTSTGSGWTRFKLGGLAVLYRSLTGGDNISFGITFSETPYIIYSVNTGSATVHPNDLLWNVTTAHLSYDSNYGSTTKYTTYMVVFGKYSGNL